MNLPPVHYLAVLVAGIAIFALGGLWYSPVLFAKKWMELRGITEAEMKTESLPLQYAMVFLCGLITAWVMAVILNHFPNLTLTRALEAAFLCWLGFAAVTSYATAIFSMKPKALWLIDSGFNLVSFLVAAAILALWR
ncbi:MAG: DUF1761 domain-containing protein [Gemmatimonadota bacterium]|nr:DUF1761 domain-containing protein [Gemmatimonadota bacterium]